MTTGSPLRPANTGHRRMPIQARALFAIGWEDARARHRDQWHVENFPLELDRGLLPAGIADSLQDLTGGGSVSMLSAPGELTGAWRAANLVEMPASAFDRQRVPGLDVQARSGRFYPRGFFACSPKVSDDQERPARVTAVDEAFLSADFNHPLARYGLKLTVAIDRQPPQDSPPGEPRRDPLRMLLRHPGMAAPLLDGANTDYGDRGTGMGRPDETDDGTFYRIPRLVQHLDSRALATLSSLYAELLPRGARVLDLMGSHDSHLADAAPASLTVLGMNADELRVNARAQQRLVHNLNDAPKTTLPGHSFDAVVCTASIEYLTDPAAVIAEVRRLLIPGGLFVVSFSNRWFPTKAIRIWSELHEFERLGMVAQWLHSAGFTGLNTLSCRGLPRPPDDRYAREIPLSDPVYAVWGSNPSA